MNVALALFDDRQTRPREAHSPDALFSSIIGRLRQRECRRTEPRKRHNKDPSIGRN